jgi:ABC-2 type transport system permease protein
MSATLTHSWFMTARHLRNLARQPWWIAITLVQPVIWLLLFGAVFKAAADIPGFAASPLRRLPDPGDRRHDSRLRRAARRSPPPRTGAWS